MARSAVGSSHSFANSQVPAVREEAGIRAAKPTDGLTILFISFFFLGTRRSTDGSKSRRENTSISVASKLLLEFRPSLAGFFFLFFWFFVLAFKMRLWVGLTGAITHRQKRRRLAT